MQDEDNFQKVIDEINTSGKSADDKLNALNDLIAQLNPGDHNAEICRASELGAIIAKQAGRPEMAAQFCLIRAKAEIAKVASFLKELKELTMAIDWFDFALESEKKRHKELTEKLKFTWANTESFIQAGYKLVNQKAYIGAVAYCHRTAGEIYAAYYLQLKLYYFVSGRPWRARVGNSIVARWLGLDDLFIMSKKARQHLRSVKEDSLKSLHSAARMFREEKAFAYEIETYFDLALEHHSFNHPIKSKYYLWWGWVLMKCRNLKESRLARTFKSLSALPLFGGVSRDK